jgi:hypothetical protein
MKPGTTMLDQQKFGNQAAVVVRELIDAAELAKRWSLPVSWIREQTRSRASDPLPHVRFGKYVRFAWLSPELEQWLNRRRKNEKR